jgi:hypothetical protein
MRKKRNYWNIENAKKCALNFENKRDFKKKFIGAYELLRKNGILDEACVHMVNLKNKEKWTYDLCFEVASKYDDLHSFRIENSWAYVVALKNGWINNINQHMKKTKRKIKWSRKNCELEAKKYTYRNEFKLKSYNCYSAAYRNGWLDDICKHMENKKHVLKWSKEKCHNIAKKYQFRNEFRLNDSKAYYAAQYNKWLDDICSHMKFKKLPNKYWHNYDNCLNEALKYKNKTEFITQSQHVYSIALKNGWIDNICSHMTPIGDRYNKCIYVYEFEDNHVYVGLTYNLKVREKSRKQDNKDAVILHIKKTGFKPVLYQLTDYLPVDDAIILEGEFLEKYRNEGWFLLNKRKTGGIGSTTPVWNFNRMKKIILNFKSINEFKLKENDLYKICERSGWLDSLFN